MYRDPYRRYRRQMRRAFRGRRGGYPVLFPIPYEPLVLIAAAAFSRWAYRNRSAFLPFAITAAVFLTAVNLHHNHAASWLIIAPITGLASFILGVPHRVLWTIPAGTITSKGLLWAWEKCGMDRPAERAYITIVIAVTGGWLAAAVALGPTEKPLPVVAGIATVILGIPWWAHRRRRARVRALRTIQTWPTIAENMGLPGSRIISIVADAWGWTARVKLRKGTSTAQAIARIPEIESGLGVRPGSVRVFPDGKRADRFILRVIENDPHAGPVPWPGQWVTSVTKRIDIGVSEDGRPVRILVLRRNILIGGIMGSGKSGILHLIIANLAACRDVVLWGVDLKGGMELQPWATCFERLAVTPQQATQLFRDAIKRLNQRAARMATEGKRVWEPTPEDPALIIIVDEYAELPACAHTEADSLARRGRAVAVNLIAATQRPTQAAMGKNTAVRSQMDIRICLRVREPRDADLILAQGMVNSGWHAHKLTKPGQFLISSPEHTTPERNRAYLLTDARRDYHAAQCAPARPRLAPSQPHTPDIPPTGPQSPQTAPEGLAGGDEYPRPETALWGALTGAGPAGVSVAELEAASGMSRSWVYYRLQDHARAGRAVQVRRGYWRAARPGNGPPGTSRPPARPTPGRPPRGPGR